MPARRPLRALFCMAALATTTILAGCTTTVSGSGSLADGVQTPSVDDPTSDPTSDPTADPTDDSGGGTTDGSTDDTTASPTDDGSGDGGSGGGGGTAPAGSACSILKPSELQAIFGEPVTVKPQGARDCDFKTADGGVSVNVYDFLNLTETKQTDTPGTDITIAGHPAWQVEKRWVDIARSKDPSAAGMIVAYNQFYSAPDAGLPKVRALMEKIVPAFPK